MTKIDAIIEIVSDYLMIMEVVYRIVSKYSRDKIYFKKRTCPELAVKDVAYFFNDRIKAEIRIDTDAVKWNKTLDNKHKTFSDSGSEDDTKDQKNSGNTKATRQDNNSRARSRSTTKQRKIQRENL